MSLIDRIRGYRNVTEKTFISDVDISKPTMLIAAKFSTRSILIRLLNLLCFFGILRLHTRILPIDSRVGVKLFFENLFDDEIPAYEEVPFLIEYPGPPGKQRRHWRINLPSLKKRGDRCLAKTKSLFNPEISGTHRLIIFARPHLQYADHHGVTERKYKIIEKNWTAPFYISSGMEVRMLIIVILTLMISIIVLLVSILNLLRPIIIKGIL